MFNDWDPRDGDARDGDDGIRDREEDWRDARDREDECGGVDPRDVFMRDLYLPRGRERELVHDRDRDYTLNGSDTRTLSTVGAFRVVQEGDLRDPRDGAFDVRENDLRHLETQGLIQRVPLDGRERAIALTARGRGLLERHRERDSRERQDWHDLRHEYASRLVEHGVPLSQVRDLLGHASIVTTERYDNQRPEALFEAARRLETGESFKNLSRSRLDEHGNTAQTPSANDANLLERFQKGIGVDDGVRTRDFRSHSPALYH